MSFSGFSETDRKAIGLLGIDEDRLLDQLRVFRADSAHLRLEKPCTVGDGIERLAEGAKTRFLEVYQGAADAGRFTKFVPASGAATRMFDCLFKALGRNPEELRRWVDSPGVGEIPEGEAFATFIRGVERFAFYPAWREAVARGGDDLDACLAQGRYHRALNFLLKGDGLGFGGLPKALIPFHRYGDEVRTALEEHLVEAARYVRDAGGLCRVHFTVSVEHEERFRRFLERVVCGYESRFQCRFRVGLSCQDPRTNTLAVDLDNQPFRADDGRLVFRPAGHGALLGNLNRLGGDLVYIKNVDNVVPDPWKRATVRWKKILGGYLVELQGEVYRYLEQLEEGGAGDDLLERVRAFVENRLGTRLSRRAWEGSRRERCRRLVELLDRPLRVCGMVRNVGEPGGGPFWVRDRDGACSLQIVEKAQVRMDDPDQAAVWNRSTHFNPVDIVCALRDRRGCPYDLTRFVDREAVFITTKSMAGRDLKALELPGLWNGSMARWNTVFVEVPRVTFNPVKTVNDLLRPEHQPGTGPDQR